MRRSRNCGATCGGGRGGEKAANAVGILALVAGQDVEPADGSDGRWRITRGTAYDRMVSTVDPDAPHVHKTRSHQQDGFKAHLAIEAETAMSTAAARRQAATDPEWQAAYRRWRPPVERAVAWLVAHGDRKLRYRGTIKNNAWLHTRTAALNL